MIHRRRPWVCSVLMSVGLLGVSASLACSEDDPISHEAEIQPIWTANCTEGCHEDMGDWAFPNLTQGEAFGEIIGVPAVQVIQTSKLNYVEPGDPAASYLLHKIKGTQMSVMGGSATMPCADSIPGVCESDGMPLSQADIDLIEQWIDEGAER